MKLEEKNSSARLLEAIMADISIRNVPDAIYVALKEQASLEGKGLETWLREQLTVFVSKPVIKRHYKLRATSEDGALAAIIRRDGQTVLNTAHCSPSSSRSVSRLSTWSNATSQEIGNRRLRG